MRTYGVCSACGQSTRITHHHLARRENDQNLIFDVCMPDHYGYFTPWHETSGVTPGINSTMAAMMGFAQHQTLKFERYGYPDVAMGWRRIDHRMSGTHGKRQLKWARPRRVGKETKMDSDIISLISKTAKQTASLWNALVDHPGLPEPVAMMIMTCAEYFRTMAEQPETWIRYSDSRAYTPALDDVRFIIPELTHFLHYARKSERVTV